MKLWLPREVAKNKKMHNCELYSLRPQEEWKYLKQVTGGTC
jgi:hypothetical protein